MTNEKALEVLEMFLHKQCSLKRTEFAYDQITVWHAVNMATEALEASQWIPVSEDLPIDCILVLVTYIDEDVNFPIVDIGYHTSRGFCDRDFNVIEVLAWMELPKPFEAEE